MVFFIVKEIHLFSNFLVLLQDHLHWSIKVLKVKSKKVMIDNDHVIDVYHEVFNFPNENVVRCYVIEELLIFILLLLQVYILVDEAILVLQVHNYFNVDFN